MAQVWLVTGSSRGLGRAIVEAGLAAGNKVWPQLGALSSWLICRNDMVIISSASRWMLPMKQQQQTR